MLKTQAFNKQDFRCRLLEAIARRTGKPPGKLWTVFARECGIGISVFQQYLDRADPSEPRSENLLKIASHAGVTPEWLLYGTAAERVTISLIGRKVPAHQMSDQLAVFPYGENSFKVGKDNRPVGNPTLFIPRSIDNTDAKAYALQVKGSTLAPRFWPDDILEVRTDAQVKTGDIAVVHTKVGRTFVRRVEVQPRAERVLCLPWGPGDQVTEVPLIDLQFMHRVLALRANGTY